MQDGKENQGAPNQVNPGQEDQFGKEVVISKNAGISDQGNEWSDEEGITTKGSGVLGEKAEKYLKESADIEDLPEEADSEEALNYDKNRSASVNDDDDGENANEVIEDEEEKVPGYDLGRDKVQ